MFLIYIFLNLLVPIYSIQASSAPIGELDSLISGNQASSLRNSLETPLKSKILEKAKLCEVLTDLNKFKASLKINENEFVKAYFFSIQDPLIKIKDLKDLFKNSSFKTKVVEIINKKTKQAHDSLKIHITQNKDQFDIILYKIEGEERLIHDIIVSHIDKIKPIEDSNRNANLKKLPSTYRFFAFSFEVQDDRFKPDGSLSNLFNEETLSQILNDNPSLKNKTIETLSKKNPAITYDFQFDFEIKSKLKGIFLVTLYQIILDEDAIIQQILQNPKVSRMSESYLTEILKNPSENGISSQIEENLYKGPTNAIYLTYAFPLKEKGRFYKSQIPIIHNIINQDASLKRSFIELANKELFDPLNPDQALILIHIEKNLLLKIYIINKKEVLRSRFEKPNDTHVIENTSELYDLEALSLNENEFINKAVSVHYQDPFFKGNLLLNNINDLLNEDGEFKNLFIELANEEFDDPLKPAKTRIMAQIQEDGYLKIYVFELENKKEILRSRFKEPNDNHAIENTSELYALETLNLNENEFINQAVSLHYQDPFFKKKSILNNINDLLNEDGEFKNIFIRLVNDEHFDTLNSDQTRIVSEIQADGSLKIYVFEIENKKEILRSRFEGYAEVNKIEYPDELKNTLNLNENEFINKAVSLHYQDPFFKGNPILNNINVLLNEDGDFKNLFIRLVNDEFDDPLKPAKTRIVSQLQADGSLKIYVFELKNKKEILLSRFEEYDKVNEIEYSDELKNTLNLNENEFINQAVSVHYQDRFPKGSPLLNNINVLLNEDRAFKNLFIKLANEELFNPLKPSKTRIVSQIQDDGSLKIYVFDMTTIEDLKKFWEKEILDTDNYTIDEDYIGTSIDEDKIPTNKKVKKSFAFEFYLDALEENKIKLLPKIIDPILNNKNLKQKIIKKLNKEFAENEFDIEFNQNNIKNIIMYSKDSNFNFDFGYVEFKIYIAELE